MEYRLVAHHHMISWWAALCWKMARKKGAKAGKMSAMARKKGAKARKSTAMARKKNETAHKPYAMTRKVYL